MSADAVVAAIARPMLSAIFWVGGYNALRNPEPLAQRASGVLAEVTPTLERASLPAEPELLVRANAAVQIGGATLMALGIAPRASALVLAASLVPTTIAGHRFWDEEEPRARSMQQVQFAKNVSILGGLLLAARG